MEHREKTPAVSSSLKMGICLSFAGLLMLAACDMQNERPAPRPVSFNPPGTAPAALPAATIVWYHVESDSDSTRIWAKGRQAIVSASDSMAGNATTATVVGKTDTVGSGAATMRLARDRAMAVRQAMLTTGNMTPNRIETRWTGERMPDGGPARRAIP